MFPSDESLMIVRRSRSLGQRRLAAALLLFVFCGVSTLWFLSICLHPMHTPVRVISSSISVLRYDTRPCRSHPSAATCDRQWVVAPWYLQIPAGKDGNEACL